jgi:hypothetical protein
VSTVETDVQQVDLLARVAHEANRAYCEALVRDRTPGEPLKLPARWHQTTSEDRASKRLGVQRALQGATPEQLHQGWCETKLTAGWRYGDELDHDRKEHPCLVEYDRLPEDQRRKDALFLAVVAALA